MNFHFPKPLHGWRAYAGEVGTIVLGVLLALGAQELVQGLHWRSEVKETRGAIDGELARDIAVFNYRYSNNGCVADRLNEVSRWADSFETGKPLTLKHEIDEPPYFLIRTSAWELTDGEIASRIPVQAKLNYAGIYDAMRKYDQMKNDESLAWSKLNEYQTAKQLNAADLRAIRRAIKDISDVNEMQGPFRSAIDRFADALGIRAQRELEGADSPTLHQWQKEACAPLL
jgi:hypothetical protein